MQNEFNLYHCFDIYIMLKQEVIGSVINLP